MNCPACGSENLEAARYCGACGAPLGTACPSCGAAVTPGLVYCTACGARLAEPEERKVVTVLFADLVDFTRRAGRLDPEDVRRLLAPYYVRLRAELEEGRRDEAEAQLVRALEVFRRLGADSYVREGETLLAPQGRPG